MTNAQIAERFEEVARLLEAQHANQYRVQAWRAGAATLRALHDEVRDILQREGLAGLDRLPTIGPSLARAAQALVEHGRLAILDRLKGRSEPGDILTTVPGIGPRLADRLFGELGIDTLEDLEMAAHDGRLAQLGGFGEKRLAAIRDALATRLRRRRQEPASTTDRPAVSELLDVDREYREGVAAGTLPRIAPRRFNPQRERWLPVLHAVRGSRHYTALFSNTARAHQAGRTEDWVVLYHDGQDGEHQHTVITARRGELEGRRVVAGREAECQAWYEDETRREAAAGRA